MALLCGLVNAAPAAADATIVSDGPLVSIRTTPDLNCAVNHRDDSAGEFYGDTACATLVAVGGVLYGPASIPAGSSASPRTTFTPVSQSSVTGSGSASDPYVIVTVVDAGPVRVTQRDSYVTGYGAYRTDVQLRNTSGGHLDPVLYRAGDCYLQNSDVGYGAVEGTAVACTTEPEGTPGSRVEQWAPLTAGSSYLEAGYSEVWQWIGTQRAFPNTCRCADSVDNGAGLSWTVPLDGGQSLTASHLLSFSPRGVAADTSGDGVVRVAVLGDSFIAGVGGVDPGKPYDEGTDTSGNRCRRTSYSWGPKIAARLGATGDNLLFAACNGAKSPDVTSRGQQRESGPGIHGSQPQVDTLRDWARSTPPPESRERAADIVLLSIGGNDVGFAGLASDCLTGPCLWFAQDRLENRARDARYRLAETYRSVLATAKESNPDVELWVANYPSPVSGEVCGEVGYLPGYGRVNGYGIDRAEQVFLRDRFLATLHESVAWAADAVGAHVLDLSDMASDHELCSSAPYFNGVSPGFQGDGPYVVSSRTFHPNKAGYAHFDEEIWNRYSLDFGQASRTPLGGSGPIPLLAGSIRLGPDPVSLQDSAPAEVLFQPGGQVHLRVVDAPPGNYRLVVRSLPTVLKDVVVPPSGDLEMSFEVPKWLAPHSHQLTLEASGGIPILNTTLHVGTLPGCATGTSDADLDGDGLPDRCDAVSDDGPDADADRDGVINADDNCSTASNPAQSDVDADGLGDACDPSQGGDPTSGYRTLETAPVVGPPAGGGVPNQPQSPGPAGGSDTIGPDATLTAKRSQKLGKAVTLVVGCRNEACIATASGILGLPRTRAATAAAWRKLRNVTNPIARGTQVTLRLKLSKKARGAIARALRKRKKVKAKITVIARDAAGNSTVLKKVIRIKPRST